MSFSIQPLPANQKAAEPEDGRLHRDFFRWLGRLASSLSGFVLLESATPQEITGGVDVTATDEVGISGVSETASGVVGISDSSAGGYFESTSGKGVHAKCSGTGVALRVEGDQTNPVRAPISVVTCNAEPTGPNEVGDMYVTSAGVLKICTVAGSPGTWVNVGSQ
jgi:hypothetical protein